MSSFTDPNSGLNEGDRISGYRLVRKTALPEIEAVFYELVHEATNARHVHIANAFDENTFSVVFKTVPQDSTGVAHILEHTVLCGSEKFPVRDPFFSMIKRSLNTFMNAFTASDWTMYPFCSQNKKDFNNLLDVYLDAAFFPNIERLNFLQEGHRMEIEEADGGESRLVYKGVVYNEMRGAMSSPDQVLSRSLGNALYPSTTYRFNSGGDPAVIPELTHEQLTAFHTRHYHPSNAFFYTGGNLPLKDHLAFIQEKVLGKYGKIDPKTEVPPQSRWTGPKTVEYAYPLSPTEDPKKKYQVCVAWLVADITDPFEVLVLTLLEQILLGNPASPLYKALIESGLGSALSDYAGYDPDYRDTLFSCGLKDVEESAAAGIEKIIFDTLADLANNGVHRDLIDSAIHQIEFHRKEVTNTPYPFGLKLLLSFTGSWIHGGDPVRTLKFHHDMETIRDEVKKGGFFENRIKKYFLDNPHRVLFKLVPDVSLEQKENERLARELRQARESMSEADLDRIREEAEALGKLQESEEDLSCLPTLELSDILPDVSRAKGDTPGGAPYVCYKQPTAGIYYLVAAAGAGGLDNDLLDLAPFFCFAFPKVGSRKRSYVEMARLIDAKTGGLEITAQAQTAFDEAGNCLPLLLLDGKCLARNIDPMFDIVKELALEADFSDTERLKNLVLEYRASLESMIVQTGSKLANSLASRNFSPARFLTERWEGVHQLLTIKALTKDLSGEKLDSLAEKLALIGNNLFTDRNLKMALIAEDAGLEDGFSAAGDLLGGLKKGDALGFALPDRTIPDTLPLEGWHTSTAVSFVAKTFKAVRLDHPDAPALAVIAKLLWSLYIHREIREKGGAYGGHSFYNNEDGIFGFVSYRDPHIVSTLKTYDRASDFILSGKYTDEHIKEAILQICADIDKPDPPGKLARKAFLRKLMALSDETRKQYKERLIGMTRKQVGDIAEKYFGSDSRRAVAVISSAGKLKEANGKMAGKPLDLREI